MAIRMVVTDIDGTLLNGENQISPADASAIDRAVRSGVKVVLATGRVRDSAMVFKRHIGLTTPVICCNGAMVADEDREWFVSTIPEDKLRRILRLLDDNAMYYHAFADGIKHCRDIDNYGKMRTLEINDTMPSPERSKMRWYQSGEDMAGAVDGRAVKVLFIEESPEKIQRIKRELEEIEGISCLSSWSDYVDVNVSGVSKATGVQVVADAYGIPMEDVMCVGDNENDISMLTCAGLGVAMGNAEQFVKDVARVVAPDNDSNGLAWAIDTYVLNG